MSHANIMPMSCRAQSGISPTLSPLRRLAVLAVASFPPPPLQARQTCAVVVCSPISLKAFLLKLVESFHELAILRAEQ